MIGGSARFRTDFVGFRTESVIMARPCDVGAVGGDADVRPEPRSSSAADYRAIAGARIEMLPGVGHSPPIEEPGRTAELLLSFAAAHPPRAAG